MDKNERFLKELVDMMEGMADMMECSSRANWGNDKDWQDEIKFYRKEILEHLKRRIK